MRIQHNIPALNSYRNYANNVSKVSKNLEKLSTGYKINRAGDDAAGLAISEKMRIQITGLEKAQDNAKSGINLIQTAEGALTEVHDMLNRMYDLAEQSANGTFDDSVDRKQLQKEVESLRTEIDRIADATNYNGIKLLDGTMSSNGKVANFKNLPPITTGTGTTATSTAALTAVRDGSEERKSANGKYELNLAGATWTAIADDAEVEISFGGITLTATLEKAGDILTGEQVAKVLVDYINAGGEDGGIWSNGDATATPPVAASAVGFEVEDGEFVDGNFQIEGKSLNVSQSNGVITFIGVDDTELDAGADTSFTVVGDAVDNIHGDADGGNQAWPMGWSELEEAVSASSTLLAQATVDLSSITIKDGTTLRIGDTSYIFAVGKESKFKDAENVVDLTNLETIGTAQLQEVTQKLSGVANDNQYVHVETSRTDATNNPATTGKLLLTEKVGGPARDKYDLFGGSASTTDATTGTVIDTPDATWKSKDGQSMVQFGQATVNGSALTLQIGDTSEVFNQLKVSVKDTHAEALGLSKIDISRQGNAQEAMNAIKSATNYISDVRGGLGALQNRLDHTINNLSVAQENIQDAESNIRDVDVAKEMMAYTKNNILVQSAQAMLAQANQLPQGVLQLLG